jgi:hypothetical protein
MRLIETGLTDDERIWIGTPPATPATTIPTSIIGWVWSWCCCGSGTGRSGWHVCWRRGRHVRWRRGGHVRWRRGRHVRWRRGRHVRRFIRRSRARGKFLPGNSLATPRRLRLMCIEGQGSNYSYPYEQNNKNRKRYFHKRPLSLPFIGEQITELFRLRAELSGQSPVHSFKRART